MYLQHFGLTHAPLGKAIPELWDDGALAPLKERFRWLLDAPGVGLVTGESGVGKTAAMRQLTQTLNPHRRSTRCATTPAKPKCRMFCLCLRLHRRLGQNIRQTKRRRVIVVAMERCERSEVSFRGGRRTARAAEGIVVANFSLPKSEDSFRVSRKMATRLNLLLELRRQPLMEEIFQDEYQNSMYRVFTYPPDFNFHLTFMGIYEIFFVLNLS